MAASILMVDMSARKRLLALTSASLAAVLSLSGCAAGAAPRDASAEPGEEAHCDLLTGARRTVDYHLSLLLALDDPAAMEELSGSDAPFRIDPGAFRTAVEALSMLSGTEGEMNRLRRIGQLLEERAGMEDPFAQGSDTGKQLAELANGAFGEVRVGLDTALQTVGCRVR
jgi:predicted RNase H-like nuclease